MKLVTYESLNELRAGILIQDQVVDASEAAKAANLHPKVNWNSTREILGWSEDVLKQLENAAVHLASSNDSSKVYPLSEVRLGPPVTDPEKIICLGLNYSDHAKEANLDIPKAPMLFAKYRNSLVGPQDAIVVPEITKIVDYEAELAVVIGRTVKDIPEEEALSCVAGVMALNDVSARDIQNKTSQWTAGKAIDTFAPCGPALVTMDEIGDIQNLKIVCRVNGEVVQEANTSLMIFPVAETISFISKLMTLEPGDIIATGTPAGVGFKRNPQVLLNDGDVVEVEIEKVGLISNPVKSKVALSAKGANA